MTIPALPPIPQRNDPATFADRGDAFLAALPAWATAVDAVAVAVDADAAAAAASQAIATAKANDAAASALDALTQANNAGAAANFKGNWSALTGAMNIPATVYHLQTYWQLAANTADITTIVPGTSSQWLPIGGGQGLVVIPLGVI